MRDGPGAAGNPKLTVEPCLVQKVGRRRADVRQVFPTPPEDRFPKRYSNITYSLIGISIGLPEIPKLPSVPAEFLRNEPNMYLVFMGLQN
jgi:hypothetical protein